MGNFQRMATDTLVGGEVNSLAPNLIGTAEAVRAENIDPRDLRGAKTRNGRERFSSSFASDSAIAGLKTWARDNGTNYVIIRIGTTFYDASAASFASIGVGGTADAVFQAAALGASGATGLMCIACPGLAVQKYDGTTFAALDGSPPSGSKYAVVWISRLILAGEPANPQTKFFSEVGQPENFVTGPEGAFSQTTQRSGGGVIVGMAANRHALLTFYRNKTWIMTGDASTNVREDLLIERGLVSETAHATAGEVVFFASDDAVYMVAGTRISDITTLKFKETYDSITDKSKISLGVSGDLLLVVDYGTNKAYACAYKFNRWATWTGQFWQVMDTALDGTFYAGTDNGSSTQVYTLDSGSLDGASTVNASWRTPNMGFDWDDAIKNLDTIKVHAKPGIGTVNVTFYKNGNAIDTAFDLDAFASTGEHSWVRRAGQQVARGEYLGMKLSWTGPGTVYGWAMYAQIQTESGQIPRE